jgi:hypothetical protein
VVLNSGDSSVELLTKQAKEAASTISLEYK